MRSFTAVAWCALAVLVVVMILEQQLVAGTTFVMGGSSGWTNTADMDYDKWLSNYKVKAGDSVRFCNPDTTDHTAVVCDKEAYDSCGEKGQMLSPFTISYGQCYEVTFKASGDFWFICDVPAHCVQGMKVYIQVYNKDGTANTTSTTQAPPPALRSSADPMQAGFSWSSHLVIVLVSTFSLMAAAAFC